MIISISYAEVHVIPQITLELAYRVYVLFFYKMLVFILKVTQSYSLYVLIPLHSCDVNVFDHT